MRRSFPRNLKTIKRGRSRLFCIDQFPSIERMDLLMQLPCEFSVSSHVSEEISDQYPEQKQRFQSARDAGILAEFIVDVPHELRLFTFFAASGRLGAGECSAITAAIGRGYDLAIDDARARREALAFHAELKVLERRSLWYQRLSSTYSPLQRATRLNRCGNLNIVSSSNQTHSPTCSSSHIPQRNLLSRSPRKRITLVESTNMLERYNEEIR